MGFGCVNTQQHPPNTALKGKTTFFPHSLCFPIPNSLHLPIPNSLHLPIPNSLLPHISMCFFFFPLFCLGRGRERIRAKAGSRRVQGVLFPSPNIDFSSEHNSENSDFLPEVALPTEEKREIKGDVLHLSFARNASSELWQTGFGFILERTFLEG